MPGVRWNDENIIESINEGFFESKNINNNNILNYYNSDFLEIEYVNDLNREIRTIENHINNTFFDIAYHFKHKNTKLMMNTTLTDMEEKAPMWRAFMRIWYTLEKTAVFRLIDDYYFFTVKYYYLWVFFFFFQYFIRQKKYQNV